MYYMVCYGYSQVLCRSGLFCASIYLRVLWRRVLRPWTILGLPEFSKRNQADKLVTKGIYSHIRHPRYLEVFLALWAIALFSNNLAVYVVGLAYIPLIYLVVILEERELRIRFGTKYVDYCARVPRFIPRIKAQNRS